MSARIRIHSVAIVTPENRYEFAFKDGINAITGEIGSGKSTLLELAKYALGGDADLRPAVHDGVRRVVVDMSFGQPRYRFSRNIGGLEVEVLDADGLVAEVLSVNKRKSQTRAADYLLGLIDWPQLRVASKRSPGNSKPISFFDLYSYLYVSQAEIDRSVVHHLETVREPKRKATFELLLGLTSEEVEQARVDIGRLQQDADGRRKHLATIDDFLAHGNTPSEEQLRMRRAAAVDRIEDSKAAIARAQATVDSLSLSMERLRREIAEAVDAVRSSEFRLGELDAELAERRSLADEVRMGLARLERAGSAASILGGIEFHQCPRCLQVIDVERFDESTCYVCAQPEPEARSEDLQEPESAIRRERQRLSGLEDEIAALDADTQRDRVAVENSRRDMSRRIDRAEGELEDRSQQELGPAIETLKAASSEMASAQELVRQIDIQLSLWAERSRLEEPVRDLERQIAERTEELDRELAAVAERRTRVSELSDVFDEIIQALDMPWYEAGARIDPKTYLPVVNGVDIKNLGSGGMKMMTNVAYHLALLTYGLANRIDTIPDLLIIDSPRKNLGSSPEDQAHAEAFYQWISALTRAYEGRFQLIVADNDEPPAGTPLSTHIRFSHAEPLVRDLPHPGDGVETIGSD